MNSREFALSVRFTSDWRIGTGEGLHGEADEVVARDESGFPFVPAKTLTGILRDAAETVAAALDHHHEGGSSGKPLPASATDSPHHVAGWQGICEVLFGSQPVADARAGMHDRRPLPARVSVRAATFSEAFRSAFRSGAKAAPSGSGEVSHGAERDFRLLEAITFRKVGIAIDPGTGTAKAAALRLLEVVRGGAPLMAPIELDLAGLEETVRLSCVALLWAAVRVVERLGGDRRRGLGRCTLELLESVNGEMSSLADRRIEEALRSTHPGRVAAASASASRAAGEAVSQGVAAVAECLFFRFVSRNCG